MKRNIILFSLLIFNLLNLLSCNKYSDNRYSEYKNELMNKIMQCRTYAEHPMDMEIFSYDSIIFGNHERKNGLEWIILEKSDDTILLMSKYIITNKRFNRNGSKCKYETSDLYEWANNSFINSAFNKYEQSLIGIDDYKEIKLIDDNIIEKYFTNSGNIDTKKLKTDTYDYWISEIGESELLSRYIDKNGNINEYGDFVDREKGFRPIIELNFNNSYKLLNIESQINKSKIIYDYDACSEPLSFDTVIFGKYEQDNNLENGPEDLEWLIIEKENGKAHLMTKYIIDYQPYFDEKENNKKYENSNMRKWLNTTFYNKAFSNEEKNIIINSKYKENNDKILPYERLVRPKIVVNGTPNINTYITKYVSSKTNKVGVNNIVREEYLLYWHYSSINEDGKMLIRPCIWVETRNIKTNVENKYYKNADVTFNINSKKANRNIYRLEDVKKARLVSEYNRNTNIESFDTVVFGSYEQDNNIDNGKEGIEWIVLDRDDEKALLLSKYILKNISFHDKDEEVYWEHASARSWCNEIFLNDAFENDKDIIIKLKNKNLFNPIYRLLHDKFGNKDTEDFVSLMGLYEIRKYFNVISNIDEYNIQLMTVPTAFAMVGSKYNASYWLKTNGEGNWSDGGNDRSYGIKNACIDEQGRIKLAGKSYFSGWAWLGDMGMNSERNENFEFSGMRPMVCIDISDENRIKNINYCSPYINPNINNINFTEFGNRYPIEEVKSARKINQHKYKDLNYVDTILFGRYEQDNNFENGPEKIEWLKIDENENNILMLSKYVLDCIQNDKENIEDKMYENNAVIKWLNDEFMKRVFTDSEEKKINIIKNINDPFATISQIEKNYGKVFLINKNLITNIDEGIGKGILTAYAYINNDYNYVGEDKTIITFYKDSDYDLYDDHGLEYSIDYGIIDDDVIMNYSKNFKIEFSPKSEMYKYIGIRPAILINKNMLE